MKPVDLGAYYESILENEVRKEGGIYYTPPFIVDYIVKHTLGELLKGKTPKDAEKIKIVDPSCSTVIIAQDITDRFAAVTYRRANATSFLAFVPHS